MPSYWAGPECTTLLRSVREQRALPAAPPSIWVFFCQEVFREHPHRPLVCRHRRRPLAAVYVYSQIIGAVRDSNRLAVPVAATYLGNTSTHLWTDYDSNPAVFGSDASTANTNERRLLYLRNPALGQHYSTLFQLDDGRTTNHKDLPVSLQHRLSRNFTRLSRAPAPEPISELTIFAGREFASSMPASPGYS